CVVARGDGVPAPERSQPPLRQAGDAQQQPLDGREQGRQQEPAQCQQQRAVQTERERCRVAARHKNLRLEVVSRRTALLMLPGPGVLLKPLLTTPPAAPPALQSLRENASPPSACSTQPRSSPPSRNCE